MEIFGQRPRKITIGHDSIGAPGGGDEKMIFALSRGFIRSDIELSIESHLIAFAAEESRLNNGAPVYIDKYR
jgi:hypothetical protein